MSLFSKKSQVKVGKQTQVPANKLQIKQQSPFAAIGNAWKKLNSMDRKQAYTWGAIAVVAVIAILMLGSLATSERADDFEDFESRGYDLANMPFSSDEAEQYLLASKYPDMQDNQAFGLYSEEEKAERQAEDAAEAASLEDGASGTDDNANYIPGRYYTGSGSGGGGTGGGRGGARTRTQIGQLNSASLKGGSGSGISGSFGPSGDFSNFRSQEKGNDKAPSTRGSGNARKALFQTAQGSRAAAGLKDNKLLNAKKAMMGGDVEGGKAFMNDSGAVDLGEAKGLSLDPNAPISSADLSGLDDALSKAEMAAKKEDKKEDDFWTALGKRLLEEALSAVVNKTIDAAFGAIEDSFDRAKAIRRQEQAQWADFNAAAAEAHAKGESSFTVGEQTYALNAGWNGKGKYSSYEKKNDKGNYKATDQRFNSNATNNINANGYEHSRDRSTPSCSSGKKWDKSEERCI